MGGRIAWRSRLARPDLVDALVLVGAGIPIEDWSAEMNAHGGASTSS